MLRRKLRHNILLYNCIILLLITFGISSNMATRYNRQNHVSYAPSGTVGNKYHFGGTTPTAANNNDVYAVADSQAMTDDYMAQFANNHQQQQQHHVPTSDNTLIVNHQPLSSCQTVCACKWKGGKQTVECIDHALIQIPENIDPSTQVLDMSGNKLQTLSNEQFIRANLLNLQKLYLRNCKIGEIETETFKGLTNLVELDLSHNLLVVVPTLALGYVASLRELTLAANHIHKIESKAFANTPALHKLDLSHCDIQTIAPQAFVGLEGLTLLRLNGNKLSEILPKTIETLSRLHGIELHDNPWMCDCRLRDAKLWLMQKNIPYPVAPTCSGGPERIIDRTFAELQIDEFACRPEMLPISHYVEATMGENASIVCRAKAIPTGVMHWYWNGRLLSNNSAFSSYQRVHMYEDNSQQFEKRSRLVLTNAQETDSSEFYCIAENKAGTAEANFTLHVSVRAAGMASLGSSEIVGLSAALFVIILVILIVVLFLLVRVKRQPYVESKTPNHLEVITSVNNQNSICNKTQAVTANGNIIGGGNGGGVVIGNGAIPHTLDNHHQQQVDNLEHQTHSVNSTGSESAKFANLVQKPPRLTDLPYSTSGYDSSGSILSTAPCFISPTTSIGNNPDLINDTKRFGSDEFTDLKIPTILTTTTAAAGNASGEYRRAGGCDSLYPSGIWHDQSIAGTSSAEDLFMKRFNDKTPIIESNQMYDFSKTFPRTHINNNASGCANVAVNNATTSTAALLHGGSGFLGSTSATTTTTNLSTSSGVNGYPNDYGLPLVPGAELQHAAHQLQMHPLQQHLGGNGSGSVSGSPHFSSRTLPRLHENNTASSSHSSPIPAHTATTHILPNGQPVNAKTIRVWQKGGVPVLPPVTALKRALISSSRNSPDEGYQEGCGTDV